MVMRWQIHTNGRTSNISCQSDEFKGTPLASCLGGLIKTWTFPKHRIQGDPINFQFTFGSPGKANPFEPLLPDLPVRTVQEMALKELERIRLILRGGSVIEWRRLHFRTRDEVDRFLRLCLINPDDPVDQAWARVILSDAVDYLRRTFDYRVSDAVAQPAEIHDLFLYASVMKEPVRYRRIACVVLKVMHVTPHMAGRDILYRLAIAQADLH